MKQLLKTSVLVFALAPSAAFAQAIAPSPAPSQPDATKSVMSAGLTMLSKAMEAQRQARAGMLAALTPAHRMLLAKVVGELAVAPDPNFDAAAAQIDGSLSPGEAQAIRSIEAEKLSQTLFDASQMRSNLQSSMTPEQAQQFEKDAAQTTQSAMANGAGAMMVKAAQTDADPGHALLATLLAGMQPGAKILERMAAPNPAHP